MSQSVFVEECYRKTHQHHAALIGCIIQRNDVYIFIRKIASIGYFFLQLTGERRSSKVHISSREFMTQFLQGLSFQLPLLLIVLISLFFIWIFSPSAS